MKKNLFKISIAVSILCILSSCGNRHRYHGLDVSVSESGSIYQLKARYNTDKTAAVQEYINEKLKPGRLFTSADDYFDITTELEDNTRFYLKAAPGRILIKINKRENTDASCARIKEMCQGVAAMLREN